MPVEVVGGVHGLDVDALRRRPRRGDGVAAGLAPVVDVHRRRGAALEREPGEVRGARS